MSQRTYWHLEALGRRPTDYEISTSKLLYYVDRGGFEVEVPVAAWYERYQRGSPLVCRDWDEFRDPRETTYATYVEMQREKEAFVRSVLRADESSGPTLGLAGEWRRTLSGILAPLRYPVHGLQMLAAYFGHMAPSGRVVVASAFQAADEMRRVQWLAYRTRQLSLDGSSARDAAASARGVWQSDSHWQPLRECLEKLLVAYDWGEALVGTCFALKPRFDELWMTRLADLAQREGDGVLQRILFSLNEDCRWHRQWSAALVRHALCDRPTNAEVVAGWLRHWDPLAERAVVALTPLLGDGNGSLDSTLSAMELACRAHRIDAGLLEEAR